MALYVGGAVIGAVSALVWHGEFWPATATILAACTAWAWFLDRFLS